MRKGGAEYSNGTGTKENIRAIEQDIARHQENLKELYSKVEDIGRTKWQVILAAIGVLIVLIGGLWALAVSPVSKDLARIDEWARAISGTATVRGIALAEHNIKITHLEDMFAILRARVQKVADDHVTNKEFNAALGATIATRVELQRQVDALIKKVDDVFPPQKTLEDLTKRLAELERTRVLFGGGPK